MSATLSNISDLASFLKADTFSSQFRPVDLREYVKIGRTVYSVEVASGSCSVRLHPHRELTSGLQVLGSVGTQSVTLLTSGNSMSFTNHCSPGEEVRPGPAGSTGDRGSPPVLPRVLCHQETVSERCSSPLQTPPPVPCGGRFWSPFQTAAVSGGGGRGGVSRSDPDGPGGCGLSPLWADGR
jgi:hypothetical protein